MKSWARLSLRKERKRYAAEGAFVLVHAVALGEGAAIDHHAKLYQQRIGSEALSASHQPLLIAADYVQPLVDQLCGVASWSCCFLLFLIVLSYVLYMNFVRDEGCIAFASFGCPRALPCIENRPLLQNI